MMFDFGERLKCARERKDLTQAQVMRITNISDKAISRYENNAAFPDLDTIRQLLALYDISANYLFGLSENMENSEISKSNQVLSNYSLSVLYKMSDDSRKKVEEYIQMLYICEHVKKHRGHIK